MAISKINVAGIKELIARAIGNCAGLLPRIIVLFISVMTIVTGILLIVGTRWGWPYLIDTPGLHPHVILIKKLGNLNALKLFNYLIGTMAVIAGIVLCLFFGR